MKKLICFGEALIDLLSNRINSDNNQPETFTKFAGGAPANVAVAAAKLGSDAYFCGMLGKDMFGSFLYESLQQNSVKTDYVFFTEQAKTALAFVSLNKDGERTFEFYRPPAADLCFHAENFNDGWFVDSGVFHFCSNSLTEQSIYEATCKGVELAIKSNWLISFDVNLRQNLWQNLSYSKSRIEALLQQSNVIKMAVEELDFLRESVDADSYIQQLLLGKPQLILITDGGNPLLWFSKKNKGVIPPPKITMVDATAAGDAFVGGLLYQLCQPKIDIDTLVDSDDLISSVLEFACRCGGYAAAHQGAFPSLPDQKLLTSFFKD